MALHLYWYDLVCFGIVGCSWGCALWVIWKREGSSEESSAYESESLLGADAAELVGHVEHVGHVGHGQLWRSCWKGVHPKWLLASRSVSLAVLAGFLAWDVVEWDASIFIYYTEWTFALVMLYFALGVMASARGWWAMAVASRKTQRAGKWGYVMQAAFQTCGGAVILTDVVFWCVIVPFLSNAHLGLNLLMGCMHTLNLLFLLLDTALNSLPFPWFRVAYFVQWSCVYVVFQWVIHACGFSWWPYPFLELDTAWAPLWYLCLALIHIPCYGIYALIVKAKYTLLPKLFPHAFPNGMAMEWQVAVCAVVIVIPAAVAVKHIKRERETSGSSSFHLWNCCWRNISPFWLLCYRAFAFLCLALILYTMLARLGPFALYFYTQWTLALVMCYFGLASVISAQGCWMLVTKKQELEEKIKGWGHIMQALYHTSAGACMLTDLVFWCLLVPLQANVQFQLTLLIGCLHTVNAVFLIGDTALNGLPFTWLGFPHFMLWSCLYITFQWIVHACGFMTWWPYPFLELTTPWAPLWYVGMALFHVPCYGIYALLFKAKTSILPTWFPRSYVTFNYS